MKNTRKINTDPILAGLANRLNGDITFEGLEPYAEERFDFQLPPYISWCKVRNLFRVRMCLGGKNRVLGVTPNLAAAARYADAARLYFWPFRLRGVHVPTDNEFIYSKQSAEQDLASNSELIETLALIKEHFLTAGVISEELPQKVPRQTVAKVMASSVAEYFDRVNEAFQSLTDQNERIIRMLSALGGGPVVNTACAAPVDLRPSGEISADAETLSYLLEFAIQSYFKNNPDSRWWRGNTMNVRRFLEENLDSKMVKKFDSRLSLKLDLLLQEVEQHKLTACMLEGELRDPRHAWMFPNANYRTDEQPNQ